MSYDEQLMTLPKLASVIASDAPFKDVANAVLTGRSDDPTLPNSGGLTPDPALERILFGRRSAFAGGSARLSYAATPRLNFEAIVGGLRAKHLGDRSDVVNLIYPEVTSESAGLDVSYALSRRTRIGAEADLVKSKSPLLDNTGTSARASISQDVGRRWFFELSAGGGSTSASVGNPKTVTYSVGAGARFGNNSFTGSIYRNMIDAYIVALGPSASYFTAAQGLWHWGGPRSPWWIDESFSYFHDAPPNQPPPHTWQNQFVVGREVGGGYAIVFQYGVGRMGSRRYIENGQQYHLAQSALRVAVAWTPAARRHQPRRSTPH